jgi:hypothetical protein
MKRFVPVLLVVLGVAVGQLLDVPEASAQFAPPRGSGSSSSHTPTATEHVAHDLQVRTLHSDGGVVSNAAATAAAFTANPDALTCLDGPSCAKSVTYNATTGFTFTGAGLRASSYTATAASGSNGFSCTTNGCRFDIGTGASDHFTSDGSVIETSTHIRANRFIATAGVYEASSGSSVLIRSGQSTGTAATTPAYRFAVNPATLSTAGDLVATFYRDNGTTSVLSIDKDGAVLPVGGTLRTCASALEGLIARDSAAGGTTGNRTRVCVCTSDGAGTPAYAWVNLGSGTVGNTTTCPN